MERNFIMMDIVTSILILIFICAIVAIPIIAIMDEIKYQKIFKRMNELLDEIEKKINDADGNEVNDIEKIIVDNTEKIIKGKE